MYHQLVVSYHSLLSCVPFRCSLSRTCCVSLSQPLFILYYWIEILTPCNLPAMWRGKGFEFNMKKGRVKPAQGGGPGSRSFWKDGGDRVQVNQSIKWGLYSHLCLTSSTTSGMIPPVASDPDPTTQIAWPSPRGRGQESAPPGAIQEDGLTVPSGSGRKARSKSPPGKRQLTTWDFITLSISMAGAQIAWTVELG